MIERFFQKQFHLIIASLCLAYAVIEFLYVNRLPLIMDEFQGAVAVNKLASQIPYRDFMPYKTILGYYIQLIPLSLPGDIWSKLIYVKQTMVVINTVAIFFAAQMLARHFNRAAVCLATVALICMSTFLERSGALRVDMLTSWFGLFSLLFMLEKRMITSGILVALSFLVSQKGIYFAASAGLALTTHWFFALPDRRTLRNLFRFALAALIPIVVYFGINGLLGDSISSVTNQVVLKHKPIVLSKLLYREVGKYWFQTLYRNPFFYGATVLAIGRLFTKREDNYINWVLGVYGAALFALCIWHKQPWPYFFVLLIPTGYVLIAALFHGEISRLGRPSIPLLAILLALGIGFPLLRVPTVMKQDNGPQKETVIFADHILTEEDTYLDGVSMIFNHRHAPGLGWLDRRTLKRIKHRGPKFIIHQIESAKPKLYIHNYRVRSLPKKVKKYLRHSYKHLWGNVHIYCPTVNSGDTDFSLYFDGNYLLEYSKKDAQSFVHVDDHRAQPKEILVLKSGKHHSSSKASFRLCFQPKNWTEKANPRPKGSRWMFRNPYTY